MLVLAVGLLPASRAKNLLLRLLGHDVAPTATVGSCLLVQVGRLSLGEHAYLGTGTVVRSVRLVRLGEHAAIGQWNWLSATPAFQRVDPSDDRPGTLVVGRHSAVTSRHYLDLSGGVSIGDLTTIAGVRSTIITHGIDVVANVQTAHPIAVGDRCLISSNTAFVPGCSVPDGCLVGMGSVIKGTLPLPGHLYVGTPATAKRPISGKHFTRTEGFVAAAPAPW